jgi:metal-responsive CopG/Arc/MetJ family transcriptional regulator
LQLHVEIKEALYEKCKRALKVLGYVTTSEFVREKIREAIKEAERD